MIRNTFCFTALLLVGVSAFAAETASDFGDAVRHMIQQQIHDPKTAAAPAVEAPNRLDGERAAAALKAYRQPPASASAPAADEWPSANATNP